jgi:hypothetical protein
MPGLPVLDNSHFFYRNASYLFTSPTRFWLKFPVSPAVSSYCMFFHLASFPLRILRRRGQGITFKLPSPMLDFLKAGKQDGEPTLRLTLYLSLIYFLTADSEHLRLCSHCKVQSSEFDFGFVATKAKINLMHYPTDSAQPAHNGRVQHCPTSISFCYSPGRGIV